MAADVRAVTRIAIDTKRLCVAATAVALLWVAPPGAWGMSKVEVDEVHKQRFEDLRAIDVLTCELSGWELRYEGLDTKKPSVRLVGDKEGDNETMALLFNKDKTQVIQFFEGRPLASFARLVPPRSYFSITEGAVVLPFFGTVWSEGFSCAQTSPGCLSHLQIMADPAFESAFPVIGGVFLGPDESGVLGGQCTPGLSNARWLEKLAIDARMNKEDRAACGEFAAQLFLGAFGLLQSKSADEDLVDSYRWLKLALGHVDELEPEEQQYAGFSARTAMQIAAERMTPEQIGEAERIAAEWKPDPSRCRNASEPGAPEGQRK